MAYFYLDNFAPMAYTWTMVGVGITVLETKAFAARAKGRMSAAEIERAIETIARDPLCGDLIQGTGGIRHGRNSQGPFCHRRPGQERRCSDRLSLLQRVDAGLSSDRVRQEREGQSHESRAQRPRSGRPGAASKLWRIIMAKEAFDSIMAGLSDAVAYAKGDKSRGTARVIEVPTVDVAAARKKLGLTQEGFASVFRVSVGTVRNWEQKRRRPEGPAKVLLAMIERDPEAVLRTLHGL